MTEQEALAKMKAPGDWRSNKPRGTVIQILVTSSCNLHCFSCTQLSQMERPHWVMTPEQFNQACLSLTGYQGVVGVFGGNPCMSKHFQEYCNILRTHFPKGQCGLWSNDPLTPENAQKCRETFDVGVSNLNVHLSKRAYDMFKTYWPESRPFGLDRDSRHSPCFVSMTDIGIPESERWEKISECQINKYWSAGIGVFRGELRAWFCEIAMSASVAHQHEADYPDTGMRIVNADGESPWERADLLPNGSIEAQRAAIGKVQWWQLPMGYFRGQVRKHCHECSVPLRGHGELSQGNKNITPSSPESKEQVSVTHQSVYKPKRKGRSVELVTVPAQLGKPLERVTSYLQNGGLS